MSNKAVKTIQSTYQKAAENTFIRAGIQLIPSIGGALDVLVFSKASQIKESRINELISNLQDNYRMIDEKKIDFAFLDSEEYLEFFERCLIEITIRSQINFRKKIVNILTNATLIDFKSLDKELLLKILVSMSDKHLKLLAACIESQGKGFFTINLSTLFKLIGTYGDSSACDQARAELGFLVSLGLIEKTYDVDVDEEKYNGGASADISEYHRVNILGKQLMEFISEPVDSLT